ncbi:MAG: hypothetical protein Q7U28_04275 [Aquabacterium sp.]|nr:hypothetical protein [Aquabacterium sp.]
MTKLVVLGSGMVSALGYNAAASLAALRAGISGVQETPWFDFESGKPIQGAKAPLPQWSEDITKLADLLAPAVWECLQLAQPMAPDLIPIAIGVAAPQRPCRMVGLDETLLAHLAARLAVRLHPDSCIFASDQMGGALALAHAHAVIEKKRANRVIVAGVDSFLGQGVLDAYTSRRRIMTPSNSNGFFPGEAGAAVLLGEAGQTDRDGLVILGFGWAQETATIDSQLPFKAAGMTAAVQHALRASGLALKDVAYRLTDLSGEHYKFKEAAFVAGRLNGGERQVPLDLWHPIEYLGEIGAAILPCLLAQALHAGREGYAPGALALCHVGSDAGGRAAVVVGYEQAKRGHPK